MNWHRTRLKFIAAVPITNGLGEAGGQDDPSWPRYIRTTDIAGPRSLRSDVFASLPVDVARKAMIHRGDIVMTAAGATIGKTLLYESDAPACYAGYLVRFRPRHEVDSRFISYWMQSREYWDQIQVGKVVSTIENFSASKYQNLTLSCPDLDGQRAIADYLDAETARIDSLIEKRRLLVSRLGERRMAVMTDGVRGAITGVTRPSHLPWIDRSGENWREVKLTLVARLGSGHTPSREHPEWWEDPTVPWITTGEVSQMRSDRIEFITETREEISELGLMNSAAERHPAGTVVLCRTASAGYSAIMGEAMATSQDFATWTCGPLLRPRFLLLCLRTMRQDLLGRLAMGSTHKTIYMPDIEAIKVPLPSVQEQDLIVEAVWKRLSRIDAAVDGLANQIVLLTEHRQALITAAVTGQLDIPGLAA